MSKMRALIIDDEPEIVRTVEAVLESLGYEHDAAGSQEEARSKLERPAYGVILLDLNIPLRSGRGFSRIQNGLNLLEEIGAADSTARIPIIVMTAHGTNSPELAVEVMEKGASSFINKPFPTSGRTLDAVIKQVLQRKSPAPAMTRKPEIPTDLAAGEQRGRAVDLAISPDWIKLCGIQICAEAERTIFRKTLDQLRYKTQYKNWVAFHAEDLADLTLSDGGGNSVTSALSKGLEDACATLQARLQISIEPQDMVTHTPRSGYHFAKGLSVRVEGADGVMQEVEPDRAKDRPQWILQQLRRGVRLRIPTIIRRFEYTERTAHRDLDPLKRAGLIEMDGHHLRLRPASKARP